MRYLALLVDDVAIEDLCSMRRAKRAMDAYKQRKSLPTSSSSSEHARHTDEFSKMLKLLKEASREQLEVYQKERARKVSLYEVVSHMPPPLTSLAGLGGSKVNFGKVGGTLPLRGSNALVSDEAEEKQNFSGEICCFGFVFRFRSYRYELDSLSFSIKCILSSWGM